MSISEAKRAAHLALNEPARAGRAGKVVAAVLGALIVANALLIFIVFDGTIDEFTHRGLFLFDAASTAVFAVEYLCRIWTADLLYPDHPPGRARLRYVVSPMGIVDLLAVAPFVAVLVGAIPYQTLNSFRVLRVMRLIKVSRYMRGLAAIANVLKSRRNEIVASFTVLFVLAITASVLMYQVENPVQPEQFDSVLTGMYWAITTITSTGYGDLVPLTPLGRLIGFVVMALSIALVAIPGGIFTAGFIEEMRRQEMERNAVKRPGTGASAEGAAAPRPTDEAPNPDEGERPDNARADGAHPTDPTHCPHCGKPLR